MSTADEIIRRLESEANEIARDYHERQAELQREEDIVRMEMLLDDLIDAVHQRGDADRLRNLGVRIKETNDGVLWFLKGHKKLTVRPRANMTVKVGQATIYPNRDCPVMDEKFYTDVMSRVLGWAEAMARKE